MCNFIFTPSYWSSTTMEFLDSESSKTKDFLKEGLLRNLYLKYPKRHFWKNDFYSIFSKDLWLIFESYLLFILCDGSCPVPWGEGGCNSGIDCMSYIVAVRNLLIQVSSKGVPCCDTSNVVWESKWLKAKKAPLCLQWDQTRSPLSEPLILSQRMLEPIAAVMEERQWDTLERSACHCRTHSHTAGAETHTDMKRGCRLGTERTQFVDFPAQTHL